MTTTQNTLWEIYGKAQFRLSPSSRPQDCSTRQSREHQQQHLSYPSGPVIHCMERNTIWGGVFILTTFARVSFFKSMTDNPEQNVIRIDSSSYGVSFHILSATHAFLHICHTLLDYFSSAHPSWDGSLAATNWLKVTVKIPDSNKVIMVY